MVHMYEFAIRVLLYLIPLYITNASALLFGGKHSLDFGKKLLGKPIFGRGKTIEGTIGGLFAGLVSVGLIIFFFGEFTPLLHRNYLLVGTLLCTGAIGGDLLGSFIKRRSGIPRGGRVFLLDQLDFVIGGIALSYWLVIPTPLEATLIIIITILIHSLANYAAFKLKMKKVPW